MRQKRAKTYRKLMALYAMSFGFRQPYQVLVDGDMCKIAVESKIELAKQLGVVLQGTVKPMITQCCIHELYIQGKSQQPAVDIAKSFERRKCNHREPIPPDECLASVVGETNKHRYVIATQLQALRIKLRNIPGVPILHVNRSVMVLEPPSEATLRAKQSTEDDALKPDLPDLPMLSSTSTTTEPPRKKKGPKGPNPLSVKKKKTSVQDPGTSAKGKMKKLNSYSAESTAIGVGVKRKRTADDDSGREPKVEGQQDIVHDAPHNKRKRKRRKQDISTVPT